MIAPAGDDHRERNHIITGAYADLYHRNKSFAWAGLAAYASKQVGCAMDHAQKVKRESYNPLAKDMAEYTNEMLGKGNKELFLDIYPMHRFYEEQGFDRMKECAAERPGGPLPSAALDGFAALDKYDKTSDPKYLKEHIRAIAFHEQVTVLQNGIYNDPKMRKVLDLNEGAAGDAGGLSEPGEGPVLKADEFDLPEEFVRWTGGNPADVVMSSECSDGTGGKKTIRFKHGERENLYDVDQRMEWIVEDIAEGYYLPNMGSPDHTDDIDTLRKRGEDHGGKYPP
jgi:hypothetical protein